MKTYLTALSTFVLAVCTLMHWSSPNANTDSQSLNVYSQYSVAESVNQGIKRKLRRGGSSRSSYSGYRGYSAPSSSYYTKPAASSYYTKPAASSYYTKPAASYYTKPAASYYASPSSYYKKTTTTYTKPSSYSYYRVPANYYSYSYNSRTFVPIAMINTYSYGYYYGNDPNPRECRPADQACINAYKSGQSSSLAGVILFFICCPAILLIVICCVCKSKKGRQSSDECYGENSENSVIVEQVVVEEEFHQGMPPMQQNMGGMQSMYNPGMPPMGQPGMMPPMGQPGGYPMMQPGQQFGHSSTMPVMQGQPPMINYPPPMPNNYNQGF